jgi:hypothetical protein
MVMDGVLEELMAISTTMKDGMIISGIIEGQMAIGAIMEGEIMRILTGKMTSRGMMELMLEMQMGVIGRSRGRDIGVVVEGEGEAVVEEGDSIKVMSLEVRARMLWAIIKLRSRDLKSMMMVVGNRMRVKCKEVRLNMLRGQEMWIGALVVTGEGMVGEIVVSGAKWFWSEGEHNRKNMGGRFFFFFFFFKKLKHLATCATVHVAKYWPHIL